MTEKIKRVLYISGSVFIGLVVVVSALPLPTPLFFVATLGAIFSGILTVVMLVVFLIKYFDVIVDDL